MKFVSQRLPDQVKIDNSSSILTQTLILENEGENAWPFDTYLVFSGNKNELNVPEEIYVGMLEAY